MRTTAPSRASRELSFRTAGRPAVGAALVVMILAMGCSAPPESVSPSLQSTPTAAPLMTPTATAAPEASSWPVVGDGWQRIDVASMGASQMTGVVWTGTRLLAVSGTGFLDSADGRAWHLQAGSLPTGSIVWGLGVSPRGVVSVGEVDGHQTSWSSPDGLTWTTNMGVFAVPSAGTDTIHVSAVVATDDGWLAVGREDPPCQLDCGFAPVRAIVWTSMDGLTWTKVDDQVSLSHAAMTSVARGGPGYIAVGQAGNHAVVWTSTDGQAWSRVPDATPFHAPTGTDQTFGASMNGVVAAGGTIVAVGEVGTQGAVGSALAWWSTDGRRWSRGTGERFLYGQLFSVAVVPGGFLATGPSGEPSCRGGVWSSADGRTWQCVANDPAFAGFAAYAAAASSDLEVVVGFVGTGADGAIWARPTP